MYETMVYWETASTEDSQPAVMRDYADLAGGRQDRLLVDSRRQFQRADPARANIRSGRRAPTEAAADRDITIGGPGLAAHALEAALVDECHLFLNPVVVGGGTHALPAGLRLDLDLLDERRFGNGVVYLRYRVN